MALLSRMSAFVKRTFLQVTSMSAFDPTAVTSASGNASAAMLTRASPTAVMVLAASARFSAEKETVTV
jgi:hypothetical protein